MTNIMLLKQATKKSLNIGVFDPSLISQASPYCGDNVFAKGLELNGFDVIRFDYRAHHDPNDELVRTVMNMKVKPTLVWIGKAERILPLTLQILRQICPDAIFVKWAADVRHEPPQHDLDHNEHVDWFFGTFAGEYLQKFLKPNMTGVGSIFTFTDADFYKGIEVNETWFSDVLWTGRSSVGDNPIRNEVLNHLITQKQKYAQFEDHNRKTIEIYTPENWLGNPEYLYAINGTSIGVGVNSFNRRKYSSDRLGNYMACGAFYLTHYIDGIEEVFDRGVHLDWFHTIDELDEKIEYYLTHSLERNTIAAAGQKRVLEYFDCKPLLFNLLNIITSHKSANDWDEIYLNE